MKGFGEGFDVIYLQGPNECILLGSILIALELYEKLV